MGPHSVQEWAISRTFTQRSAMTPSMNAANRPRFPSGWAEAGQTSLRRVSALWMRAAWVTWA